jgi:hypothetical protein
MGGTVPGQLTATLPDCQLPHNTRGPPSYPPRPTVRATILYMPGSYTSADLREETATSSRLPLLPPQDGPIRPAPGPATPALPFAVVPGRPCPGPLSPIAAGRFRRKRRATRGTTFGTTFEIHKPLRIRRLRLRVERRAIVPRGMGYHFGNAAIPAGGFFRSGARQFLFPVVRRTPRLPAAGLGLKSLHNRDQPMAIYQVVEGRKKRGVGGA